MGARALHRERYVTSTGTRWPSKNDGRVVVRLLINSGIRPVAGDAKIARYVTEYTAKLAAKTPPPAPSSVGSSSAKRK